MGIWFLQTQLLNKKIVVRLWKIWLYLSMLLKKSKNSFFNFYIYQWHQTLENKKKIHAYKNIRKKIITTILLFLLYLELSPFGGWKGTFSLKIINIRAKKNRITSVNDCTIRLNIPLIFLGDKLSSSLITSISLPCRPIAMRMHFLKEKLKKKVSFLIFSNTKKWKLKIMLKNYSSSNDKYKP